MRLTPQMVTALRTGAHPIAPLIRADLPGYTMLHLVGSAEVMWGTDKYVGRDPRFGVLVSAGNLKDGVGDEAPDWELTFAPPDESAAADLSSAAMQGSPVTGWLAVTDRTTGQLLPNPLPVFAGTLDFARLKVGRGTRNVVWTCVSVLDVFHDNDEGSRLSDAWHKAVWPGETGLANMTGIERTSYWGVEKPPPNVSYTVNSPVYGG